MWNNLPHLLQAMILINIVLNHGMVLVFPDYEYQTVNTSTYPGINCL
jgi:hypothetical protein